MDKVLPWHELSRAHQKLLERLWGGGSLRGQDDAVAIGLQRMGYVQGEKITPAGIAVCEQAFRETMARMPSKNSESDIPATDQSSEGSAPSPEGTVPTSDDKLFDDLEALAKIARGE